jgi:hypothetical protein
MAAILASSLTAFAKSDNHDIIVLSNRADLVSGGDALVEVVVPPGVIQALRSGARLAIEASIDGTPVPSDTFVVRSDGRIYGLVKGLKVGENVLTVQAPGKSMRIVITNHPSGGPIFAGPQVQPWICQTVEAGLGAALDAQCNAPTKVEYFYRSSNPAKPGFLPYNPANPPTDVRNTTTDQGITVPFIVRRERGTLDRFVYDIAVLANPAAVILPWQSPAAWNHKLYYLYGGGAKPQHKQGLPSGVFHELALSRGFATATGSGNVFGNSTNSVTSAELTMMVKERVIETLGEIRYTLAEGPSGGSMGQHLVANTYPGLLDGIQPSASFQDIWTTNNEVQDCSLLLRYFDQNPQLWASEVQQNAVLDNSGESPGTNTCRAWVGSETLAIGTIQILLDTAWMNPTSASCFGPSGIGVGTPQPWMYDPVTNPTGARCTMQDYQVALFGRRPDGFANRPYDNNGIQYGLKALKAGTISTEQFVHMNEHVGGRDIDWNWTSARSVADQFALGVAYRSGQVNLGTGLATVPIIDLRGCGNFEIHSCYHSWVMRQRLIESNGHAANHVILAYPFADDLVPGIPGPSGAAAQLESFNLLDRWVAAIKADTSSEPLADKVAHNRPADATDACWVNGVRTTDAAACAAVIQFYGDPRTGAAEPLAVDVMKCQLTPLVRTSYPVTFSDSQWSRFQAVFPNGVCAWDLESVGFQSPVPWLTYADGPGGKPIGSAPQAQH